jgi:hypothetical protein
MSRRRSKPPPALALGDRLEWERVDSKLRARRFYALEVCTDPQLSLPGFMEGAGLALLIVHGPLEGYRVVVREPFADMEALTRRWREIVRKRELHQYVVTRKVDGSRPPPPRKGRGGMSKAKGNTPRKA